MHEIVLYDGLKGQ